MLILSKMAEIMTFWQYMILLSYSHKNVKCIPLQNKVSQHGALWGLSVNKHGLPFYFYDMISSFFPILKGTVFIQITNYPNIINDFKTQYFRLFFLTLLVYVAGNI